MARSLKERYETQRITLVQERVREADKQLLEEQRAANLLVEAMNEDDLKKVSAIVQKLSTIKTPQLPKLKAAIEQAEAEINKYTAGGPLTAAWAKMKKLVGIDNPIVKVTTFADALEKGFSQIPVILKNNGVDLKDVDLSKSLAATLGRLPKQPKPTGKTGKKSDKELGNASYSGKNTVSDDTIGSELPGPDESIQNEADGNAETKIKSVIAQLQKALSPGGIFGVFKKVPYINSAELAQELVQAPLNVFAGVAKKINSGTKAAEVAPDIKGQIQGAGGAETKGTEKDAPSKQTSQTSPGQPTKAPTAAVDTTPTGQQAPKPQGGGAQQNYAAAATKILTFMKSIKGNLNANQLMAKKFIDAGLDPEKL